MNENNNNREQNKQITIDKRAYINTLKKYFELLVRGADGLLLSKMYIYVQEHIQQYIMLVEKSSDSQEVKEEKLLKGNLKLKKQYYKYRFLLMNLTK